MENAFQAMLQERPVITGGRLGEAVWLPEFVEKNGTRFVALQSRDYHWTRFCGMPKKAFGALFVWFYRGRAMPLFARGTSAEAARTRGTGAEAVRQRWARSWAATADRGRQLREALSGVVWLVVATHINAGHLNPQGGIATIAMCHSIVRNCARVGDIIMLVTCAKPRQRDGAYSDERLLLGIMVVTSTIPPWIYYSVAGPTWTRERADRAYTCRLRENMRSARDQLAGADGDGRGRIARMAQVNRVTWRVQYTNGLDVRYSLRARARIHGASTVDLATRTRDWRACVLVSRVYAVFPADSDVVGHRRSSFFPPAPKR